jgi:hypothetical protein|tara:strand:+ start:230 stop:457 length:228 start_codon:yes stop_codon:yes gene_type:complete
LRSSVVSEDPETNSVTLPFYIDMQMRRPSRRRTSLAESDFDPILSLANEHVDEQRTPRREAHTFIVDLEAPVVFK